MNITKGATAVRFTPMDEKGQAEAAYGVLTLSPTRCLGFVVRWGREWTATDTTGATIGTASRRRDAAALLQ